MSRAASNHEAHGAAAATQDEAGDRPATDAERAYLDARVEETAAAVTKIGAQIKGLERSLREAEKLHEDAKAAQAAGWDCVDVAKRRVK